MFQRILCRKVKTPVPKSINLSINYISIQIPLFQTTVLTLEKNWDETMKDEEKLRPIYKIMATDILRQKARLGGTFAVAHAVASRAMRDYFRSLMGPELVFIVLNMTKECQTQRMSERHGDDVGEGWWLDYSKFQPAGVDEEKAYNITIEEGDSKQDVLNKVLEITNKNMI